MSERHTTTPDFTLLINTLYIERIKTCKYIPMNTLKIVIKAQYFDLIASGEKTIEYRDVTPFWTSRLFDENGKRRLYERIEFINGYNTNARRMVTGFEGFSTRNNLYNIKIGKIYQKPNRK